MQIYKKVANKQMSLYKNISHVIHPLGETGSAASLMNIASRFAGRFVVPARRIQRMGFRLTRISLKIIFRQHFPNGHGAPRGPHYILHFGTFSLVWAAARINTTFRISRKIAGAKTTPVRSSCNLRGPINR